MIEQKALEVMEKVKQISKDYPDILLGTEVTWDRCVDFLNALMRTGVVDGKPLSYNCFSGEWGLMVPQINYGRGIVKALLREIK